MGEDIRLLSTVGLVHLFTRQENQKGEKPTASQITSALGFTKRTFWGFFSHTSSLIQGKCIFFEKRGREHHYFVSRDILDILQNVRNNSPESQIFTSDGFTLLHIIRNPGCTIKDIADARFLTRRSIWGMIGNLWRADLIRVEKEGRRHRYSFNVDQDVGQDLDARLLAFVTILEDETKRRIKSS